MVVHVRCVPSVSETVIASRTNGIYAGTNELVRDVAENASTYIRSGKPLEHAR